MSQLTKKQLREIVRLSLSAHGGFHGGEGKPLEYYARLGCSSCAAIVAAEQALRQLEGRTGPERLVDLNLTGQEPTE